MTSILSDLLFNSLTSITATYLSILVPFVGALYIYKKSIKSTAESKIFETGRRIAEILQEPLKSYPDAAINIHASMETHVSYQGFSNKDEAIRETLIAAIRDLNHEKDEKKLYELSDKILTIAHYRYETLIPLDVSWSGKGFMVGINGVDKTLADSYFPFGTLLYRDWIDSFTNHYNDIWRTFKFVRFDILKNKHVYHCKDNAQTVACVHQAIDDWRIDLDQKINNINKLHSELITQIQIIDNTANVQGLHSSIKICTIYCILLVLSGYLIPIILLKLSLLSWIDASIFLAVSIFLMVLIPVKLLSQKDYGAPRKRVSLYKNVVQNLTFSKKIYSKYYAGFLESFCSMKKDLSINPVFIKKSEKIISEIYLVNLLSEAIHNRLNPHFLHLQSKYPKYSHPHTFPHAGVNWVGMNLSTIDLIDKDYDFSQAIKTIQRDDCHWITFSKPDHIAVRDLFSIDTSSHETKISLVDDLLLLRSEFKKTNDTNLFFDNVAKINQEAEFLSDLLQIEVDRFSKKMSHNKTHEHL